MDHIKEKYGVNYLDNVKVIACHMNYNEINITDFERAKVTVTCVREPVERLISHYYFFSKDKFNDRRLDQLSDDELKQYCAGIGNLMTIRLAGGVNDIDLAIKNVSEMDVVLVLEHLRPGLMQLKRKLEGTFKVKLTENLKKYNIGPSKIKHTHEFKNKLRQYCYNDIKLYEYCRNNFR